MICYWRFVFAFMTMVGVILIYMMRVNLSVAIVAMVNSTVFKPNNNTVPECPKPTNNETKKEKNSNGEFFWTDGEQAMLLSSFYWGYTIMQIPSGILLLFFKPKWIYGLSTLTSSILTLLIPVASNGGIYVMVLIRFLIGICEGPTFPSLYALCGSWVLASESSIIMGLISTGTTIGTIVGQSLTGFIIDRIGWRWLFYIMGCGGFVWFIVFIFVIYDNPNNHPFISDQERNLFVEYPQNDENDQMRRKLKVPWEKVLTSRPYIGFVIYFMCFNFTWYTMINCLPTYIGVVLGFEISENGNISSLPYISMLIFCIFGGLLQDLVRMKNFISVTKVRKLFGCFGMLMASILLFSIVFTGCNVPLTISLVCLCFAMLGFSNSVTAVNLIDIAPGYAGPLLAIVNCLNALCGIISPYVKHFFTATGETRKNWKNVFITNSTILLFGTVIFILFGSGTLQPWALSVDEKSLLVNEMEINSEEVSYSDSD